MSNLRNGQYTWGKGQDHNTLGKGWYAKQSAVHNFAQGDLDHEELAAVEYQKYKEYRVGWIGY